MNAVISYIKENIGKAICSNIEDTPSQFGLPYPYSVPTVGARFHAMFYWDTYFTNLAHIALGQITQARHNAENFVALIDRLGYIPNGNRPGLADRSQPPFFALMLRDIFAETRDTAWLEKMYPALVREYEFWMRERNTDRGLAHYGCAVSPALEERYARAFCERTGIPYSSETQKGIAENFLAQAESGWDFNARFELCAQDYCAVDLNSLLWAVEDQLSRFAEVLSKVEDASKWRAAAELRASRMRSFLKDENGVFWDRNDKTGELGHVFSAASLYPLFVGMAAPEEAEAARGMLPKLLHAWGVAPCEVISGGIPYQWGAPNGWPCLQVVASVGMRNYGFTAEADKIAGLYTDMVERVFEKTGALWEKYNVDSGTSDALNEYDMPEMLGWTAGAYLFFKKHDER